MRADTLFLFLLSFAFALEWANKIPEWELLHCVCASSSTTNYTHFRIGKPRTTQNTIVLPLQGNCFKMLLCDCYPTTQLVHTFLQQWAWPDFSSQLHRARDTCLCKASSAFRPLVRPFYTWARYSCHSFLVSGTLFLYLQLIGTKMKLGHFIAIIDSCDNRSARCAATSA